MKFPLVHQEKQYIPIKETDNPISMRELLQQFGFCQTPDQDTLDEANRFFKSFVSTKTVAGILYTLYYALESRSRDRLTTYLQKSFPEIYLACLHDDFDDTDTT